jgi:hypothetical protein
MFTQVGKSAQGGLGIGLSIVRRLIEMHGGTIEVDSSGLGAGTTFTVRLPLGRHDADEADVLQPAAAPECQVPALRLLVVDDNVDAAESLATLLRLSGHCVAVAADGFRGASAGCGICARGDLFWTSEMPG